MRRIFAGVSLAVALAATALAGPWAVTPAQAASGVCTAADKNAVTVVIDFQGLGGGVKAYCAKNLAKGATGLDALAAAGVSFEGTSHDGLAFICRIAGRPSATETLDLPGGKTYQEKCVNSPPGAAYWSYWTAKQGGSWGYTSQGASTRQVVFGTYEGWSFSLGGGIGNAPAPGLAPAVWAAPPSPKATTTPKPSTPPAPKTTPVPTTPKTTNRPATAPPVTAPATSGPASRTTAPPPPASTTNAPATPAATETALPSTGSQPSAGSQPAPTAAPDPPSPGSATDGSDPAAGSGGADPPGGVSLPFVLGLGLIVVMAVAAGGLAWWRRRRGTG